MAEDILGSSLNKRWHAIASAQSRREKTTWFFMMLSLFQGVVLAYLASEPSVHVVEVLPSGETTFIDDPLGNVAPRDVEILHTAERFVKGFYGWSGTDIAMDMHEALSLCAQPLRERLLNELKSSKLLERSGDELRGLWSEVRFLPGMVKDKRTDGATAHVDAEIKRFHDNVQSHEPLGSLRIALEIQVRYRRRSADYPSGVEIVSLSKRNPDVLGEVP